MIGVKFISDNCFKKFSHEAKGHGKQPKISKIDLLEKDEIIKINCFKKPCQMQKKVVSSAPKTRTSKTSKRKSREEISIQNMQNNSVCSSDCNLTDTEEEKTQTHAVMQKKAFLSIDKILTHIKK